MERADQMKYGITALLGLCLCGATRAGDADSLFFLTPRSATGYSGTGVRKTGEELPLWIPPQRNAQSKAPAEKSSTAEKPLTIFSVGYSNLGWSLSFSRYPEKMVTFVTEFAYLHESTNAKLFLKDAVADSLLDSMAAHSVQAPFAVTQETPLDHIRAGFGLRLNFLPILKSFDFLPFPINPYIGAGAFLDVSFGSTKLRPVDSLGSASSSFDPSFGGFDTTIGRLNTDIGFAFPIGLEVFPLKNINIPVIKNIGVSFVYVLNVTNRVFAMPARDLDPYKDYIDQMSGSNNASNPSGSNNTSNPTISEGPPNEYSSGNPSGGGGKSGPPIWFGWSPLGSKNEFRGCLEILF
jgi:hypothetical protein